MVRFPSKALPISIAALQNQQLLNGKTMELRAVEKFDLLLQDKDWNWGPGKSGWCPKRMWQLRLPPPSEYISVCVLEYICKRVNVYVSGTQDYNKRNLIIRFQSHNTRQAFFFFYVYVPLGHRRQQSTNQY